MRWAMATWTLMTWAMSGSRVVVHGNRRTHLLTPIVALSLRNANVPWHCQCGRWLPVAVWRHRVLRYTHRGQTSVQWLPVSGRGRVVIGSRRWVASKHFLCAGTYLARVFGGVSL